MAHAYTPGLKVSNRIHHRVLRLLPISGDVLVQVGDTVEARDIAAQTHMPGNVTPVNLANKLSMPPGDIAECLLKKQGDRIEVGDLLARTKGIFGLMKTEFKSPAAGTLESISDVTGQLMIRGENIPVEVRAYLKGEVVEVLPSEGVAIEADVTFIQGIFGIGGEAFGPIHMACTRQDEELSENLITADMKDRVVVGGARMTGAAVREAIKVGAAAVVSGGMDDQDLRDILGYDLGVAITGSEKIGTTLIITEGFGDIAMAQRTFELFASRAGDDAAVTGATQIRAGVMRPEILIPLSEEEKSSEPEAEHDSGVLDIGTPVRIIRDPHFGIIGEVGSLPNELRVLGSGSKARVLTVRVPSGEELVVPRANVELIER